MKRGIFRAQRIIKERHNIGEDKRYFQQRGSKGGHDG
jgi:hypothetical protein